MRVCVCCVYSRYDVQKGNIRNPFVFAWYLNFIYLIISHRHDWDKLKSMLSFQLKQVWGGMPACGSSAIYGCHSLACTQALLIDVHNCILVPRLWYLSVSLTLFPLSIALLPWFMKVLSEYPEGKMADEQQIASLGETYPELVKRLDEGILIPLIIYEISLRAWSWNYILVYGVRVYSFIEFSVPIFNGNCL